MSIYRLLIILAIVCSPVASLFLPAQNIQATTDYYVSEVTGRHYSPGQEVVEKRTLNSKTSYLGNGKFALSVSQGTVHFNSVLGYLDNINNALISADAPWDWRMTQDAYNTKIKNDFTAGQVLEFTYDGSTVAFQPMALEWTNNLDQIQQISMPQNVVPKISNPVTDILGTGAYACQGAIRWDNAYGVGTHFEWLNTPGRLEKILQLDNIPITPAQYIIDGGSPVLRLNFIFAPSKDLEIYVDGLLWDSKTKRQTFSNIEFRRNGATLWEFSPARYWDSSLYLPNNEGVGQSVLSKSGNNLYISVLVPYWWLQSATYPVFIDPNITLQVGLGANDALRVPVPNYWSLTFGSDAAGYSSDGYPDWGSPMLFNTVTIPNASTIDYAQLRCVGAAAQPDVIVNSRIRAEDVDNSSQFTTAANFDGRTWTTAPALVNWDAIPAWSADEDGADTRSPDIKAVVQAVVNRPGWTSSNNMTILWDDFERRSTQLSSRIRSAWSYESSTSKCPKLYIEYTPPVSIEVVTINATAVTETTATVSGNITNGGGAAPARGFAWGTTGNVTNPNQDVPPASYSDNWTETGSFGLEIFTHGLTGLSGNTTYYYRAYAYETKWAWGEQDQFTTLTFPAVNTDGSSAITETTATLSGNVTLINDTSITDRAFEYDTNSGAPYAYSVNQTGAFGLGTYSLDISSLLPTTTYYFRAVAKNDAVASYGVGIERTFTTLLPLPSPPDNFVAIDAELKETSANLTWDMGLYSRNVTIRGKIDSAPIDITDGYAALTAINITALQDTGLDLTIHTVYYKAWSQNDRGYSVTYAETSIGGEGMTGISIGIFIGAMFLLCIAMTVLSTRITQILFRLGTAVFWLSLLLFFFEYSQSSAIIFNFTQGWFIAMCLAVTMMVFGVLLMYMGKVINQGWITTKPKDRRTRSQRTTEDYADHLHTRLYGHPKKRRE